MSLIWALMKLSVLLCPRCAAWLRDISDLNVSSFMTFIISSFMTLHTSQSSLTSLSHPMCLSGENVGVNFPKPGQIIFALRIIYIKISLGIISRDLIISMYLYKNYFVSCVLPVAYCLVRASIAQSHCSIVPCPVMSVCPSLARELCSDHDIMGCMATKHAISRI